MAEILRFVPKPLPPLGEADRESVPAGPGEVIIFPGVRVERSDFLLSDRIDNDESPSTSAKRRRPKRNKK